MISGQPQKGPDFGSRKEKCLLTQALNDLLVVIEND